MTIINAADSLMAIFGYTRVTCDTCVHSVGTDGPVLLCNHRNVLVERDSQCPDFLREPGSDE